MRIAEIYASIQGEGLLTGVESIFVRTSGCNLRCWFCDTPYTSWRPEGEDLSVEDIAARVLGHAEQHVVITGGEPMLFAELVPLAEKLKAAGRRLTIETAGTLFLPVAADLMSISPKLSNSTPTPEAAPAWHDRHNRDRHCLGTVRKLVDAHPEYQLKFVVQSPQDCREVQTWLSEFGEVDPRRVMLMPQGTDASGLAAIEKWLLPYCEQQGLVYCPRKQIEWFGFRRGT